VHLLGSEFFLVKDSRANNKKAHVRVHPFLSADDDYDEEKYRDLLEKAAEEILENPNSKET
jgi:hypothetical protein